jgi:polysaccharide biosynthesis/export protein
MPPGRGALFVLPLLFSLAFLSLRSPCAFGQDLRGISQGYPSVSPGQPSPQEQVFPGGGAVPRVPYPGPFPYPASPLPMEPMPGDWGAYPGIGGGLQPFPPRPPSAERPSEFERFVSKTIEITDNQFEILKRQDGIAFFHSSTAASGGRVAVPVRVVKRTEGSPAGGVVAPPMAVDAGYVVGTPDAVAAAFRLLGIPTPYAVSMELEPFGYDLFRNPPSTFAPVDRVPVGPEYILGPGDELRVTVWGKVDGQWRVVVDRDGNIAVPKAGVVGVAALSFGEARELLRRELAKNFTGFDMNVSLGSLRTINVYVVGNAVSPGTYTVSSLSTLVNVLFAAGGPAKTGTMRDIQVRRDGETVARFDMYDLLLAGDKSRDIRLLPEDVVFIPPAGPVVAVAGSVSRPALYELSEEAGIAQLLAMAGGASPLAGKGRVRVDRIAAEGRRTVVETDLEALRERDIALESGDVVTVSRIMGELPVVRIAGAVERDGTYGFRPGMTVRDLVAASGGLKDFAYRKEAELTRVTVTDAGPRTDKIPVDLGRASSGDGEADIPLHENDYLFVRTVPEWMLYQIVTVGGEVRHPGAYTIVKGEKLSSLIARAGGFTDGAYLTGAVFTRERVRELQQRRIGEAADRLERELLGKGAVEVAAAASAEAARIKEIELTRGRVFIETMRSTRAAGRMVVKIAPPEALKETPYDIELEAGDSLYVPPNPHSVQIMGAVFNQSAFVYESGSTIAKYVDLAGGYAENADRKRVYVLKADGTAVKPGKGSGGFAWNGDRNRWEFGAQRLDPGDTIVVPERLERVAWMRETKDLTQILYQIAVTAGVLLVAF